MPGMLEYKECPSLFLLLASHFVLNFLYDLHTHMPQLQMKVCDNRHCQGILLDAFCQYSFLKQSLIFWVIFIFHYCI